MPLTGRIAQDMRFGFEIQGKKLTLYERVNIDISGQDGVEGALNPLRQVSSEGTLSDSLCRAFNALTFEPKPDRFLAHDVLSGTQYTGIYHPRRRVITHFSPATRRYNF